jgi:CDP-6-deoxy-D-xylo-4-hexulose-3-dehydrase
MKKLAKYSDIFSFQKETPDSYSSWFGFSIILKDKCPFKVKEISDYLKSKNIENRPIIAGNIGNHPVMKMYEHKMAGSQEVSNNIMKNGFALGCHQHMNETAIDYIVEHIDNFIANHKK